MRKLLILSLGLNLLFSACKQGFTPKPRGYFRIDFAPKSYVRFQQKETPFSFDVPAYTKLNQRKSLNNGHGYNLIFPKHNATIHIAYHPINNNLEVLTEEARTLVYKHVIKAEAISEQIFDNREDQVYGILYEIEGNAASHIQFYLTDSSKNFLRGALYFNHTPNKDSLAPVVKYINEDITHLMESFNWN